MPSPSSSRRASAQPATRDVAALADALFRTAAECCRQRHRYACLVDGDGMDAEQRAALAIVAVGDAALAQLVREYETAVRANGSHDEAWWHCANRMWLASREYVRHHGQSEDATRQLRDHSLSKLAELTIEYDLEASALLGLQQAADAYRGCRPTAELRGPCNGSRPPNGASKPR